MKYKLYDIFLFLRYDIWRFIKNVWRFRNELKNFGGWDWHHPLSMIRKSIEIQEEQTRKYSDEWEPTLRLKLYYMRRALYLMNTILEGDFIHLAEKSLNRKYINIPWAFKKTEDGNYEMIFNQDSEYERELNHEIYLEAEKIKKNYWIELFDILKGDFYQHDLMTEFKDKNYEDVHNGKGLVNWWF